MSDTHVHRELIHLEVNHLGREELRKHLKESINRTSNFYNALADKEFIDGDKDFLQAYWKTRLLVLLEIYRGKYGTTFDFLSLQQMDILNKIQNEGD